METLVLFVAAVVVVLTTSLFKNVEWSVKVKTAVATVLSVVAAAVGIWVTGDFDASSLPAGVLQVFGLAQLFYNFLLKGTGLNATLESTSVLGRNR